MKQCGCGCLKKPLFIYKWIEKVGGAAGAVFLLVAVVIGVLSAPQLISNPRIYWRSWILGSIYQPIGCIFGYVLWNGISSMPLAYAPRVCPSRMPLTYAPPYIAGGNYICKGGAF